MALSFRAVYSSPTFLRGLYAACNVTTHNQPAPNPEITAFTRSYFHVQVRNRVLPGGNLKGAVV